MTKQFIGSFKVWEGYEKRSPIIGPGTIFKPSSSIFKERRRTIPMAEQDEKINHPSYYGGEDDPYETIKVLEAKLTHEEFKGFCKGSAIKYLDRAKGKDEGQKEVQDYGKATWYLQYMNEAIQRKKERDENHRT